MDSRNSVADALRISELWAGLDPSLLDSCCTEKSGDFFPDRDPLEDRIRNSVFAQIASQKSPLRIWNLRMNFYAKAAAIVVLIIGITWLLSTRFLAPASSPTITKGMTTYAAITAAGTTAAGATSTATTRAAASTAAAGTQITSGPTGPVQTNQSPITWPIGLVDYLDFDLNQVHSIGIKHYNENLEIDKSLYIKDSAVIKKITQLISLVNLELSESRTVNNARYEVTFYSEIYQERPFDSSTFISFISSTNQNGFFVEGSFMHDMKLNPWDHLIQTNKYLSYRDITSVLESLEK